MTTEEKLNQTAGTIKEGVPPSFIKKFHDFHTYFMCRIV